MNVRTSVLSTAAMLGLGLGFVPIATNAATITLNYNGFNPATNVTVRNGTNFATVLDTQTGAVAGDSASSFSFTLSASGDYAIDLFGDTGGTANRSSHHIRFTYNDGTGQITGLVGTSGQRATLSGGTNLTLNTVPVYVDPQGYNPPDDANDGYKIQAEVGGSGRINLDDSTSFANGSKTITLLKSLQYMVQYPVAVSGHRQNFVLGTGGVTANDGLIDEGTTVDSTGAAGTTHQLVRFNKKTITVNTNGLSHGLAHADDQATTPYLLQALPPSFNGSVEVLAGNPGGYRLAMPRFAPTDQMNFDVDANGNITGVNPLNSRYTASGSTLALRTVGIHIDAPTVKEGITFGLNQKASQTGTDMDVLLAGLKGDQDLTLLPSVDASSIVYYLSNTGDLNNAAASSWRIVYNSTTDSYSLSTWSAGGAPITNQQSITLPSGYIVSIVVPEPASALTVGAGLFLACARRRRRQMA